MSLNWLHLPFHLTRHPHRHRAHADNYRDGALQDGVHDCDYDKQFAEKRCRSLLEVIKSACKGAVVLQWEWGNPSRELVCGQPLSNLVLWTIGNHPLNGELSVCWHRRVKPVDCSEVVLKHMELAPCALLF